MANTELTNSLQQRVHRRLESVGAGPAAFFFDACLIAQNPEKLRTATHLIGHLLREIEGNLLAVLYEVLIAAPTSVTALPSADLLPPRVSLPIPDQLQGNGNAQSDDSAASGSPNDETDRPSSHKTRVRSIVAALGLPSDGVEARQWISMAGGDKRLHRVAHRNKLNPPRPVTPEFLAEFDAVVRLFDGLLERFEARYATVYTRLDTLLARPEPGSDGVRLLGEAIPNTPRTLGYFFERLQHVGWLEPLRAAGFFDAPPPTDLDDARGTISFPHWPAADYLGRVAAVRPELVASVFEGATDTDNVRAQGQMIDIMLGLRAEDRVRLAPIVKRWVPGLTRYHWGDQGPQFALALTRDGSLESAFDLTAAVLDLPEPDPETGRRPIRTAHYLGDRQERAWHLRETATTLIPALVEADGLRALALFADALDYQVGRRPEDADADPTSPAGLVDFSALWADDLGESEGRDAADLRVYLTHITLYAARVVGTRMPDRLPDIICVLRARGARVLRRIELAMLASLVALDTESVSTAALSMATTCLTERGLVTEDEVAAEWGELLAVAFPRLYEDDRARVVAALQPPDFTWMEDEEYARARARTWRRDRLALIADYLPPDGVAELASAVNEEGEPDPLRRVGPTVSSFIGPTSPLDETALRGMKVEALLDFLQRWEPRTGFGEASPEGLGRALSKLVEEGPSQYVVWAPRFIGLQPTYVRALLEGFRSALRADRRFPWSDLLTLAEWAVEQPVPESDMRDVGFSSDADWRATRRTLAGLLGHGLALKPNEDGALPISTRERLWRVIQRLTSDPNPSPQYEDRYGGTKMDPANLAINTTRPEAIDAAIRYAYWVAGNTASGVKSSEVLEGATEAAAVLEEHLDPNVDPSLAVRAAIGCWLGSLARTDPAWVQNNLKILLPEAPEETARRDALWYAFVRMTQPHPDVLPILDAYYRRAIDRTGLNSGTAAAAWGKKADERLVEHVMTLYWWGAIGLDDPDNLIEYLFCHADAERCRHAMQFVGHSLFHTKKPVGPEPVAALQKLWEWRCPQLEAAAAGDVGVDSSQKKAAQVELEEFGWWFASAAFDDLWALRELRAVLRLTGGVHLEHAVAERLAQLSGRYPMETVQCLAAVDLTGGSEAWSVHSWIEHARVILENAIRSDVEQTQKSAREMVNRMIAAGHTQFRELLAED